MLRAVQQRLKNAQTVQYSIGYQHQLSTNISVGVDYVYKESKDFIGWDILGGDYAPVPFTDPFTGTQYTLLEQLEPPIVQKGNGPFLSDNIQELLPLVPRYRSEYNGVFVTFNKRFASGWGMSSSYTWSKSEGLLPNPLSQSQYNPQYSSSTGSNPNNFINASQRLQADRPHMFRLQGVYHLPGGVLFGTSFNIMSGRPFNRQARVRGLGVPSGVLVIMEPAGSRPELRLDTAYNWDIRLGKRFPLGDRTAIKVDGVLLNILNNDADLSLATQELAAGETFVSDAWVFPRRLMLYVGFEF